MNTSVEIVVAYQGEPGANSHIASAEVYPNAVYLPCATFEDVFQAVEAGDADVAMIPVENTVAGRVADIHHHLPASNLRIIGEHFLPIHHQLLGLKGATLKDIKTVHSHVMALGQCRNKIRELGLKQVVTADTAGAAKEIAEQGDKSKAAIASGLAAEVYELNILAADIEDAEHNTTRFLIMTKDGAWARQGQSGDTKPRMTSFVFKVRNIPAALYKALGGFATNGVNMTKLESYMLDGSFQATQFLSDIIGHPDDVAVQRAFEELKYFSTEFKILGVYECERERD